MSTQIDLSFPHNWTAEILPARPAILPARHFVYPRDAEEVERGALEVMVRPESQRAGGELRSGVPSTVVSQVPESGPGAPDVGGGLGVESVVSRVSDARPGAPDIGGELGAERAQPFLATCALGFRDPAVPTGIWAAPGPNELCAVSGGYAYVIDVFSPQRFTMIEFRPVLELRVVVDAGLLLFVGHREILAWGADGLAWKSVKLSDEGVTITKIADGVLHCMGWEMMTDKERAVAVDLKSGIVLGL